MTIVLKLKQNLQLNFNDYCAQKKPDIEFQWRIWCSTQTRTKSSKLNDNDCHAFIAFLWSLVFID